MSNLKYILSKKFNETYTISFVDGPQEIADNGFVFKTDIMNGISTISSFSDKTEGENNEVYFTKFFKYENGEITSDLIPISELSGTTFNNCSELTLELYYYRTIDGNYSDILYVDNIIINGEYVLSAYDSEAELPNKGDTVLLKPSDIYKIFSIDGFNVQSAPHNYYDIQFRFTQDDGRTYTPWESLTTENITTIKLSPIRFAQVEYSITNNSEQGLLIYDIILTGKYQNISANYLKTNRYGLKQDCLTKLQNIPGVAGSNTINRDFHTQCLSNYQLETDVTLEIENSNIQNSESIFNPYQFDKITQFANMLGNQVSNIFGWNVEYHLTDPDGNGIDTYLHEQTLKNIIAIENIKVIVPDNKFPVESLIINQFNLDMFDTFEIHIMKDEFKNKFGITKRPSQDDILYICEANMLYYVKHSQAYKDIMNAATYYKIILEKFENKTNVRNLVEKSQIKIDNLTENTTINDLFGEENKDEEKKIANKEQLYPTSFDKIRQKISSKVNIIKESIYINNFQIIKNYYDLSYNALKGKTAINYQKNENILKKSDNRSFICWSNFKNEYDIDSRPNTNMFINYNIKNNVKFNFLENYDSTNNIGYEIYYQGNGLSCKLNNKTYRLEQKLYTNIWYAFVINLDQRQKKLNMYIYKKNTDIIVTLFNETTFNKQTAILNSTEYNDYILQGYKPATNNEDIASDFILVANIEHQIEPVEFEHTENLRILGSNIYYSNLRILNDVIPTKRITNILLENILTDGQHVIMCDNANKQLITYHYYNKQFR
jgi:hypothetical protein